VVRNVSRCSRQILVCAQSGIADEDRLAPAQAQCVAGYIIAGAPHMQSADPTNVEVIVSRAGAVGGAVPAVRLPSTDDRCPSRAQYAIHAVGPELDEQSLRLIQVTTLRQ
jgi:hypothetical protein